YSSSSRCVDHSHLPSFPTRRSSDLIQEVDAIAFFFGLFNELNGLIGIHANRGRCLTATQRIVDQRLQGFLQGRMSCLLLAGFDRRYPQNTKYAWGLLLEVIAHQIHTIMVNYYPPWDHHAALRRNARLWLIVKAHPQPVANNRVDIANDDGLNQSHICNSSVHGARTVAA